MKRVLVTGGTGFIGSHLVEALIARGIQIRCLVRKTSDLQWLKHMPVELVYGDLEEPDSLLPAVRNVDVVFHLGGRTKVKVNEGYHDANVRGTENLIQALLTVDPCLKRFVYVSSQAVAGPSPDGIPVRESDKPRPLTPYGRSKLAGEAVVLKYTKQLPVTVIRPPTVYGPRDTDVYEIFKIVRNGFRAVLGWEKRYLSLIFVQDLVVGLIQASENSHAVGQIFYMVSDPCVSYHELSDEIARSLNKRAVRIHVPISLFAVWVTFSEIIAHFTGKPLVLNRYKVREARNRFWVCDASKARRMLDFKPEFPLDRGIRETVNWYREQRWL